MIFGEISRDFRASVPHFVDWAMNLLPHQKQVEVIAALVEGMGIRAAGRVTGVNRETVATLALKVGRGCAELHDRMMVGVRANLIECDELWAFVGRKRRQHEKLRRDIAVTGDQNTFIALGSSTRAIISYRTGKRDGENTDLLIQDLRERVIGTPEITTDGFHPYRPYIRDAFGPNVAHGVVNRSYSVTHLNITEASRRYSPAEVISVEEQIANGDPVTFSTSYVERQNLTIRMSSKRFARLSNGFRVPDRGSVNPTPLGGLGPGHFAA
jgi:IS1 family transposase